MIRLWNDTPLPIKDAIGIAEELKQRQTLIFESMITDRTREVFNADNT